MKSFIKRYQERVQTTQSILCVGLDLTPEHVPPEFGSGENVNHVRNYLEHVITIAAERAPVVKPQFAYYGAMGYHGIVLLKILVDFAHDKGLEVILDHKISDIGSTVEAYGRWIFGYLEVDAVTAVPYLGSSIVTPLIPWLAKGKCVISMVRTSNPEAADLQDLELANGQLVYEMIAERVRSWNEFVSKETNNIGSVGAVVGATWPEQAARCREFLGPDVFTLVPGYGAQGGGAEGAVIAVPNNQGQLYGTVNSSRGITMQSWQKKDGSPKPGDPLDHVITAIDRANADLNTALTALVERDPYGKEIKS